MGIKGKPRFERTIGDMEVGEVGYAVPWSVGFDEDEIPYLNLGMIMDKKRLGTAAMPIKRTGPGRADYDIDLDFNFFGGKYGWLPSRNPFSGVVGSEQSQIVRLDSVNSSQNIEYIIQQDHAKSFDDAPQEYPITHELRRKLSEALDNEDYESAIKLRDRINSTEEPL